MTERPSPLPHVLGNAFQVVRDATDATVGAVWHLDLDQRQLDANIIHLPPGDEIAPHDGTDLDVLVLVLDGTGVARTDDTQVTLEPGTLLWLPRWSRRSITAGSNGLSYFTVHPRRTALSIGSVHRA